MYEDFYNEGPSDYELFMNDLKETLKKSIKDEFIKEMDRLRAENKKLQNVKENFEQIKLDIDGFGRFHLLGVKFQEA